MDFVVNLNKVFLVMIAFVSCTNVRCASLATTNEFEFQKTFTPNFIIKLSPERQSALIVSVMDCLSDNEFLRVFVKNLSISNQKKIFKDLKGITKNVKHFVNNSEISVNDEMVNNSLEKSVYSIRDTLSVILYHSAEECDLVKRIDNLPEQNKQILLDLVETLTEKHVNKLQNLKKLLSKSVKLDKEIFNTSAQTIKWGFQMDQNYAEYTSCDHPEYLQSLVNCFIYCKGEEMFGIEPVISTDSLMILAQSAIEYSEYDSSSSKMFTLFEEFVKNFDF